jgi:hypothetical protein
MDGPRVARVPGVENGPGAKLNREEVTLFCAVNIVGLASWENVQTGFHTSGESIELDLVKILIFESNESKIIFFLAQNQP